jgi:hypothetical protein
MTNSASHFSDKHDVFSINSPINPWSLGLTSLLLVVLCYAGRHRCVMIVIMHMGLSAP